MDTELPSYSRISNPTSHASSATGHTVSLERSHGHKWLSLTVKSRSPDSAPLPSFYAGDVISGCVNLDIMKSEPIKAITIQVIGVLMLIGSEEEVFFNIEKDIWNPSMMLPNGVNVPRLGSGRYNWPISIRLPRETRVSVRGSEQAVPLPPTYTGRASPAYVDYRLVVTVKRGTMRVNETLQTTFGFLSVTQPALPSPMLQKAYRENLPIMGPEADPEGWYVLPAVRVSGTVFGAKQVEIGCTLAIAKPLSYCRGSPMPLMISMSGKDEHALDLLAAPSSIRVLLVKTVTVGSNTPREGAERRDAGDSFREIVAQGVFWPIRNAVSGSRRTRRVLQGEVDVKRFLHPSFSFPNIAVTYSLELLPFEATGFVASPHLSNVLAGQQIEITSVPARGIVARSHAPPEYVQEQAGDYNNAIRMLEGWNQRFLQGQGRASILPP
ncbi:hypothetical protein BJ138DRAFT_1155089 [Hygrophoropsis aurantiaca]|uniref:Uncharacterized protein n=1 Tax=Hygrophoropsis aurantiaca TaxID=72124 RepID=A0ACB8A8T8_9AGAM|nr:hypothetical protein BJ138DRAFT_1155089 [Hygrophoropsis aurantiaca]